MNALMDKSSKITMGEYDELLNAGGGLGSTSLVERPITAERYVAFLDIMGFKDRVARHSHDEILSELQQMSEFISTNLNGQSDIMFVMFSDSFLFFTEYASETVLIRLVELLSGVMDHAINNKIPIKGVIAKGTFTVDIVKQLFFGQPLIDAYSLEENIVIYGIVAHHTFERDAKVMTDWFIDKDIPLKNGNSKHYLLKWWSDGEIKTVKERLNAIRETVSDSPRRYIDKTIKAMEDAL